MHRTRLSITFACVLGVAATLVAAPAQADGSEVRYVAMGDSYAAGVGAPPYTDATCRRSDNAYGPLLAGQLQAGSFAFVACSGDTTADVTAKQLGSLSRATTLVTLTVGGNDIGFANGFGVCLQGSEADCTAAVAASEAATSTQLPPLLDALYREVKHRAPHARLLIVGYPDLFELTPDCAGTPLSLTKRTALNQAADVLDQVIAQRARKAGATFVDARPAFAGHGSCSADPWINGLVADGAFHPNATGQFSGYLAALQRYVRPCRFW